MANKEKRILVLEVNPDCKALKFDSDPFDEEDVVYCDKNGRWERIKTKDCKKCKSPVFAGITRAEAVKIMTKAIMKSIKMVGASICKQGAEAALDALLGKDVKMKYRKKPVVIEAVQWAGIITPDVEHLLGKANVLPKGTSLLIPTLEGVMEARMGDYIIRGVSGELYPCKPDIFNKTYELVEAENDK